MVNKIITAPGKRIQGYVIALERRRRSLENISLIYRDQPRIYPMQIEEVIAKLDDMRRAVRGCRTYLQRLDPQETAQLKPYACILKLSSLDYLLTELLLNVAMHAEVCACVCHDRIQLHLTIRVALPACLTSYDDTTAMLTALAAKTREPGCEGHQDKGMKREPEAIL